MRMKIKQGIFQVIGVSGIGKTVIARSSAEQLGIPFVDFADLIVQSAQSIGINMRSHDDILKLSPEILDECVNMARNSLLEISKQTVIILETHLAPNRGALGYTFTSPEILQKRKTLGIACIVDSIEGIIMKRKRRGTSRDRTSVDYNQIYYDQLVNVISGIACSLILNIPFIIIMNEYGKLDESINRLTRFILEIDKIMGEKS